MATIAENLQTLIEQKAAIKAALDNKGKEPTDALATYAGLINELENEEQISYVLTNADGSQRAYAVKNAEEAISLTATENDIRINTTAITDTGYTEGAKEIPAYFSTYGKMFAQANKEAVINVPEYDYKNIMVSIGTYNNSVSESTKVTYVSIDNAMYEANTTNKVSDITIDTTNKQVKLGITPSVLSVIRYFIVREE